MKKFYKPLSVLLAITMCVSLVAPAFAQEPVQTEPTEIVQTESAQDELEVTVEGPTPETVKPPVDDTIVDDDDTIVDNDPIVEDDGDDDTIVDNDPIVEDDGDDDTIVDNDPIVEDDGDDDTIVDDVNNAPTLSSDTLSEDQGPDRAPRSEHQHQDAWSKWESYNSAKHVRVCRHKTWGIFECGYKEYDNHQWGAWYVDGDREVRDCLDCQVRDPYTQPIQLGTQTVYVYVKVTGNTADICWDNLNGAGWFTVGEVTVNGLPDPGKYGKNATLGEEYVNQAVAAFQTSLSRYEPNMDLDLTDEISWTDGAEAGLVRSEGANDYIPDGMSKDTWDSFPTWHLNGTLKISDKYTVTYKDGVDGTVFANQEYSGLKYAGDTPEFKVNGEAVNPTREGYDFVGWSPDWAYRVSGNVTYTAQWRVKSPETPDLKVEKTALVFGPDNKLKGTDTAKPGDTIKYQITVTNLGSKAVENVVITDVLDSNKLEFQSAEGNFGSKYWTSQPDGGKYEVGTLEVSAENDGSQGAGYATLTITATVKEGATGTIANTATADCTGMPADNKPSGTANVVVEKLVTLSYNAVNGTGAPESETKAVGTDGKATFTVSSTVPTKEGYEFKGWQKGTSVVTGEIAIDQDTTLYAKWEKEPEKYTVTWSFAEDTPESLVQYLPKASQHIEGDKVGVTSYGKFQIDGKEYSFNGWNSTPTVTVGEDGTFTMPAEDVALVGSWTATELPKPVEQTIYQWLPGYGGTSDVPGTTDGAYKRETINAGDPVPEAPGDPTRDGYNFTGWSDGVEDVNKDGVKTVTYTAQWAIKTYTVTFNANGGSAVGSQTVNHGQAATRPTAPSRSGYTFNGWRLADAASDYDFATPVTGDLTLTAQWSQNTTTGGGGGGGTTGGGGGGTGGGTGGGGGGGGTPTPTPTEPDEPVVEIPDEDVPLVEVPDVEVPQTETPEELVEVPEEDVPLADVPKTGDNTGLWRMAALMSAAGLAVLTALERRQRREE